MKEHDFNWTRDGYVGEQDDCRHCGARRDYLGQTTPCTEEDKGLFERVWGMDATICDGGVLCFNCSQDLLRGNDLCFPSDTVLEADQIREGTTCESCGRVWSYHGDEETRTPNMWIQRPAVEMMRLATNDS